MAVTKRSSHGKASMIVRRGRCHVRRQRRRRCARCCAVHVDALTRVAAGSHAAGSGAGGRAGTGMLTRGPALGARAMPFTRSLLCWSGTGAGGDRRRAIVAGGLTSLLAWGIVWSWFVQIGGAWMIGASCLWLRHGEREERAGHGRAAPAGLGRDAAVGVAPPRYPGVRQRVCRTCPAASDLHAARAGIIVR